MSGRADSHSAWAVVAGLCVLVAYDFAVAFLFLGGGIAVSTVSPLVWSLPASWILMLALGMAMVFGPGDRRRLKQHGSGNGHAAVTTGALGLVLGLGFGTMYQVMLNDVFEHCSDIFTGGAAQPYCKSWTAIKGMLPWVTGLIGLVFAFGLRRNMARRPRPRV